MKRVIIAFVTLIFLSSCSAQEKVSPDIFIERFSAADENVTFNGNPEFCDDGKYTYYFTYAGLPLVAEIHIDGQENAKKINLACSEAGKAELFRQCAESVICVYSPEEKADEIIDLLFRGKDRDGTFLYHETHWYTYSVVLSENGLFFSMENRKLSPRSEVELSLKPNDIVEY